jgi:arsenite methyltransferase
VAAIQDGGAPRVNTPANWYAMGLPIRREGTFLTVAAVSYGYDFNRNWPGAYSAAARDPRGAHPFPVGRRFAESLGYPPDLLEQLPNESVEAFSGVSNVSLFSEIPRGSVVLDLGCGAGLDSLIAARRTGPAGRVIGIEFSEEMSGRARRSAAAAGFRNCLVCRADAERLRIRDNTVDVALANGIFNLNPARKAILKELARVLRPGATVYGAELILSQPLPAERQMAEADWFA